jgi:hypothetical protein
MKSYMKSYCVELLNWFWCKYNNWFNCEHEVTNRITIQKFLKCEINSIAYMFLGCEGWIYKKMSPNWLTYFRKYKYPFYSWNLLVTTVKFSTIYCIAYYPIR